MRSMVLARLDHCSFHMYPACGRLHKGFTDIITFLEAGAVMHTAVWTIIAWGLIICMLDYWVSAVLIIILSCKIQLG